MKRQHELDPALKETFEIFMTSNAETREKILKYLEEQAEKLKNKGGNGYVKL